MIQRKQSLFLLLSVLLNVLLIYLPVYELISAGVTSDGQKQYITSNAILMILNGAIGILCFVAIFFFKNRKLQMRICNLSILLTCVLIGLLFFAADSVSSAQKQVIHYLYGTYFPMIELLFIFLATRGIKKDEDLVRSADRLR
jgi:hypothetical protein